jgi:threonine/homoserine/homoserine lactone efflux protein
VGLVGGLFMIFMGVQAFRNRNKEEQTMTGLNRDSIIAGAYTTAANAGFILWWLTIGTTLILNAKLFGLAGFAVFTGVHWLTDFAWYAVVSFLIYKSQRFWTNRTHSVITLFCVAVFVGFGMYFLGSAVWSLFV